MLIVLKLIPFHLKLYEATKMLKEWLRSNTTKLRISDENEWEKENVEDSNRFLIFIVCKMHMHIFNGHARWTQSQIYEFQFSKENCTLFMEYYIDFGFMYNRHILEIGIYLNLIFFWFSELWVLPLNCGSN